MVGTQQTSLQAGKLADSDWRLQRLCAKLCHGLTRPPFFWNFPMTSPLRYFRAERGLTLEQLAEVTGLSRGFLSQLETGARQPSTATLALLAEALKVRPGDIVVPAGFSEPTAPETSAFRALRALDQPKAETPEDDFNLGTDGTRVQIIATVDKDGLDRLIRQLEAMKILLSA